MSKFLAQAHVWNLETVFGLEKFLINSLHIDDDHSERERTDYISEVENVWRAARP